MNDQTPDNASTASTRRKSPEDVLSEAELAQLRDLEQHGKQQRSAGASAVTRSAG